MPSKNVIRQYAEDQYLHIYNRGVEKRKIFIDDADYEIFLYYLFIYLADPELIKKSYPKLRPHLVRGNLFGKLSLLSYCLMPNHFHFLVHQKGSEDAQRFIKQLTNAYTQYFNTKYRRVGSLMQGRYKAIPVTTDEYLLHLSRYIHQNPLKINFVLNALRNYQWSSYNLYLGLEENEFTNQKIILGYFSKTNPNKNYANFVEGDTENSLPVDLALEDD